MDAKMLARLGAVLFVAVAVTATAIELTRKEEEPMFRSLGRAENTSADPLREELLRCQLLGEAGPRDAACLRAWAENRQRFLAPGARPAERLPDASPAPRSSGNISATTPAEADPVRKKTAPATAPEAGEAR
ncbi:putative entry exclusion protein TrbK-alt [Sphingobium scionense]|jgi:conjugative transfer region protein TrbK|uniref:Conjugative transfer region protein TrbK n=1 Tax=Sphingobium scionense TaxID=1404341 RepID=A0A7W6PWM8_9SPHN|nr:conjugative transfer region protein TrbK [Sphingobium scionense]